MNIGELLVKEAKSNQTRKILDIVKESKDKDEIEEKVRTLLEEI